MLFFPFSFYDPILVTIAAASLSQLSAPVLYTYIRKKKLQYLISQFLSPLQLVIAFFFFFTRFFF